MKRYLLQRIAVCATVVCSLIALQPEAAEACSPPQDEWFLVDDQTIPTTGTFHVLIVNWFANEPLPNDLTLVINPSQDPVEARITALPERSVPQDPWGPSTEVILEIEPAAPLPDGATYGIVGAEGEISIGLEFPTLTADSTWQPSPPTYDSVSVSNRWSTQVSQENCCERECQDSMCEDSINGPCLECVPSQYEYRRVVSAEAIGFVPGEPSFYDQEWIARDADGNETIANELFGELDSACFRLDFIDRVTGERVEGEFGCIDNPQWGPRPTEQPSGVIPDYQKELCFDDPGDVDAGSTGGDAGMDADAGGTGTRDAGVTNDGGTDEDDRGESFGSGSGCSQTSGGGHSPLLLVLLVLGLCFRRTRVWVDRGRFVDRGLTPQTSRWLV